jgi:3-deoxy-D-manno-octulosonate 8-phosphate phosphatase KdsC-like HAD superfamily phosphatase
MADGLVVRMVKLEAALKAARPYVQSYAENCPPDDGGAEAIADLEIIDALLSASSP